MLICVCMYMQPYIYTQIYEYACVRTYYHRWEWRRVDRVEGILQHDYRSVVSEWWGFGWRSDFLQEQEQGNLYMTHDIYIHIYIRKCIRIYVYTYMYIYMYMYVHIYQYRCIHTYIHIQTCKQTYTNKQAYVHSWRHTCIYAHNKVALASCRVRVRYLSMNSSACIVPQWKWYAYSTCC